MRKSNKTTLLAAAGMAMALMVANANAVPIEWTAASGGNGHFYDLIPFSGDWIGARAAALTQSHNGQQGYLLTMTSAAEKIFVNTNRRGAGFIGGNDITTEGVWVWTDGPEAGQQFWAGGSGGTATAPFNYANWHSGEPNNIGNEDGMEMGSIGTWNDLAVNSPRTSGFGYYVEFNAAPIVTGDIPEPMTLSLLGAGLTGLGLMRRRGPLSAGL